MTEDEQRRIFARNLNYYISQSGKQQKEVAKDLGYNHKTFNGWCAGRILPRTGKIQRIADYFGIGKSDLLDDKLNQSKNSTDRFVELFQKLDQHDQDLVMERTRTLLDSEKYSSKKESSDVSAIS